jgi:uncharacterized protein YodC (DUF2158 family)
MADRTFKIGDVVRLKSGGPLMTVDELTTQGTSGQPTVSVVWFEGSEQRHGTFLEAVLDQTPTA